MGYKVKITPGRTEIPKQFVLDPELKDGCESALLEGGSIYVWGKTGSGITSALKYFEQLSKKQMHIERSQIYYLSADDTLSWVNDERKAGEFTNSLEKWMNAKVVIIDDIDRRSEKEMTECGLLILMKSDRIIILGGHCNAADLPYTGPVKSVIRGFTSMEITKEPDQNERSVHDIGLMKNIEESWEEILTSIKKEYMLPTESYDTWIRCLKPEHFSEGILYVRYGGDPFGRKYVKLKYCKIIADEIRRFTGEKIIVEVC